MVRQTLYRLATPTVALAVLVAVPALAGTSAGPVANSASRTRCFRVHHTRECLIAGPRGPRGYTGSSGPRGLAGKNGKNGKNGANGKTGPTGATGATGAQGPAGTALAFALVQSNGSAAVLVTDHSSNFTQVSEPSKGVYCLTPGGGVNVNYESPVVSPEISYSSAAPPSEIAVDIQHQHNCPSSTYEVDTYNSKGELSNGYAFTIVVP